jgi:hypothetical protein
MRQLHLVRAFQHQYADKRPLLDANIRSGTDPVIRVVTSNKFYKGRFFLPGGACQSEECVLINFPKTCRGRVRLQLKVWDNIAQSISSGSTAADVKAQFLSYIGWMFGVSNIQPSALGRWPRDMTGHCTNCRTGAGDFESATYLCINPFHYSPHARREHVCRGLEQEIATCIKDRPALPGEAPRELAEGESAVGPRSRCYCPQCRPK